MKRTFAFLGFLLAVCWLVTSAAAQTTAFTYQGRLTDNGGPANGDYSFQFRVLTAQSNGSQVGGMLTADGVTVTSGRFTVQLDFGAGIFTGPARWLEIGVRPKGSVNAYTILNPRQPITATPYAIQAANAGVATLANSVPNGAIGSAQLAVNAVQPNNLANGSIGSSKLAAGAAAANLASGGLGGVASGGVILSADPNATSLINAGYVKIGKAFLGPETQWEARNNDGAPSARSYHSTVWTGSEMIVWGGLIVNGPVYIGTAGDGGRYNPTADIWSALQSTNAPTMRFGHSAVWTGSEMIIWGGTNSNAILNDGGRYNPLTDTWTAIQMTNAPSIRRNHTAVWTGSEMIIWGGDNGSTSLNDGGRYNPTTDTWTALQSTNAPATRAGHAAVWTGYEMVVWGGKNSDGYLNTGGRFNPADNSWTATQSIGAPGARSYPSSVWTGIEMIVWGGYDGRALNTGGRYNPTTDSWLPTSTIRGLSPRLAQGAVWTGEEMIIWGGSDLVANFNDGGRYNPVSNSWTATPGSGSPSVRNGHSVVWTGSEMIVWAGLDYYSYRDTFSYTPGRVLYLYQRP